MYLNSSLFPREESSAGWLKSQFRSGIITDIISHLHSTLYISVFYPFIETPEYYSSLWNIWVCCDTNFVVVIFSISLIVSLASGFSVIEHTFKNLKHRQLKQKIRVYKSFGWSGSHMFSGTHMAFIGFLVSESIYPSCDPKAMVVLLTGFYHYYPGQPYTLQVDD